MKKEVAERLVEMLKSGDEEIRLLAEAMFCAMTNDYKDYWELRTMFAPNEITLHSKFARHFHRMLNHTTVESREFIKEKISEKKKEYMEKGEVFKPGRRHIIESSCILVTKKKER